MFVKNVQHVCQQSRKHMMQNIMTPKKENTIQKMTYKLIQKEASIMLIEERVDGLTWNKT